MTRKKTNKLLIIVTILIGILIFLVPLPYYIEMPGSAENLREHVSVDGKRDKFDGSFMLTTVAIQQGTAVNLISSYFNPNTEIISKKDMMGDSDSKEYDLMQQYYMTSSQNYASKVALDLLDKPYGMDFKGIYVMAVSEDSDFYGKLTVGSTVTAIDGEKIKASEDLIEKVQSKKPGDKVTLTVEESGKTSEVSGKLIELEETKKTGIGISLVDHTELVTTDDIAFQTDEIGGPSAGLMFTLELYSLLGNKDIRNGLEIAGTGTMDSEGNVGRIGGIDKKVIAAENAGADIFFAPEDELSDELKKENPDIKTNYEEALASAKRNNLTLEIVPVKTVADAIQYLEERK